MRILIATSDYPPSTGGMAEYSRAWSGELRRRDFDVRVLAKTDAWNSDVRFHDPAVEFVEWNDSPLFSPFSAYRALRHRLCRFDADLIFAHTWIGWGPALAYLKGRVGTPYILSAHGAEILGPARSRYHGFLLRQAMKGADYVFPVSAYTAELVSDLGISRERIEIVRNGADLARFAPQAKNETLMQRYGLSGKTVVVTVGSLVARKGQDVVIRAIAGLASRYPDLRYLVVGGWKLHLSSENQLRSLARDLGVADRVIFTGFVEDRALPDHYRLGDIFALTGRTVAEKGWVEGFGISLLEAAACGLPIITTETGGTRDAISDENAIVVPVEDSIATAAAIAKLLDDSVLRRTMSAASVEWASTNSWDRRIGTAIPYLEKAGKRKKK